MKKSLIHLLHRLLAALGDAPAATAAAAPAAPSRVAEGQPAPKEAAADAPAMPLSSFPSQRPRIYNVRIVTSESRFPALMTALEKIGITGMTVTRVLGYGMEKGHNGIYSGADISSRLIPKIQCELVISKIPPERIVGIAKKVLYTGRYGDGKIFISSMENVVKIRTGEEGYDALQDKPL